MNSFRNALPMIANFAMFQIVWFSTVLGAAAGLTWPGLAALTVFVAAQAALSPAPVRDWVLCLVCLVTGIVVETANIGAGLLAYRGMADAVVLPPVWILVLWVNFGLILNHGIAWLKPLPGWSALLGAIGGAGSYAGGAALGAARFGWETIPAVAAVALTWAVVTPLLMHAARRVDRAQALGTLGRTD